MIRGFGKSIFFTLLLLSSSSCRLGNKTSETKETNPILYFATDNESQKYACVEIIPIGEINSETRCTTATIDSLDSDHRTFIDNIGSLLKTPVTIAFESGQSGEGIWYNPISKLTFPVATLDESKIEFLGVRESKDLTIGCKQSEVIFQTGTIDRNVTEFSTQQYRVKGNVNMDMFLFKVFSDRDPKFNPRACEFEFIEMQKCINDSTCDQLTTDQSALLTKIVEFSKRTKLFELEEIEGIIGIGTLSKYRR
jgi:hypothetical protein